MVTHFIKCQEHDKFLLLCWYWVMIEIKLFIAIEPSRYDSQLIRCTPPDHKNKAFQFFIFHSFPLPMLFVIWALIALHFQSRRPVALSSDQCVVKTIFSLVSSALTSSTHKDTCFVKIFHLISWLRISNYPKAKPNKDWQIYWLIISVRKEKETFFG